MNAIYKTEVNVTGGREGIAKSADGKLEVKLAPPKEMGGPVGTATNPEQLFAAGYGACFESAVRFVARQKKINITQSSVKSEVSLYNREGGFKLGVTLEVSLPGIDRATGETLVQEADKVCPYSHALKGGGAEVSVKLA